MEAADQEGIRSNGSVALLLLLLAGWLTASGRCLFGSRPVGLQNGQSGYLRDGRESGRGLCVADVCILRGFSLV